MSSSVTGSTVGESWGSTELYLSFCLSVVMETILLTHSAGRGTLSSQREAVLLAGDLLIISSTWRCEGQKGTDWTYLLLNVVTSSLWYSSNNIIGQFYSPAWFLVTAHRHPLGTETGRYSPLSTGLPTLPLAEFSTITLSSFRNNLVTHNAWYR